MAHNQVAPKTFCTTREAAKILGISLRTAQLWSESGLLEAWKTDGGHRRITRASIERLLTDPSVRIFPDHRTLAATAATPPVGEEALKILVVEDDANLRRLYEINLRRWPNNPKITLAVDGFEALIRIGQRMPDLLIADLNMPGMDGFRMLYAICSMPELAHIKTVIVSGLDAAEISRNGGVPEGIEILPKPVPFDRLRAIAEELEAAH